MTDVSLKQQVNDLLVNSPLEDELVDFWQPRLDSMNDGQLTALLNLLQNRLAIFSQYFINANWYFNIF